MPDLAPKDFKDAMLDYMGTVQYDWIVASDRPLALFLGTVMGGQRGVEVQVDWMPWTTARQKLEATATFLREVSKVMKVYLFSDEASERFFFRLCRYRMLRQGCQVLNFYGGGENARLFYTAGPV